MEKILNFIGVVLKLPLMALVLGSFIASIYLAYNGLFEISYATPIILGIIIVMYIVGLWITHLFKSKNGKSR